jgi:hypothetical protein
VKKIISVEIQRIEKHLLAITGGQFKLSIESKHPKLTNFDTIRDSMVSLDTFYSKNEKKIIDRLENEKQIDGGLASFVSFLKERFKDHIGRFVKGI